jgi:hypothetical protein
MRDSDSALAAALSFDNECTQQRVSKPSSKDGHRFLFAKPCLSRAISLARWPNFLLAIHQASAGHFNKVSRLRQV